MNKTRLPERNGPQAGSNISMETAYKILLTQYYEQGIEAREIVARPRAGIPQNNKNHPGSRSLRGDSSSFNPVNCVYFVSGSPSQVFSVSQACFSFSDATILSMATLIQTLASMPIASSWAMTIHFFSAPTPEPCMAVSARPLHTWLVKNSDCHLRWC